MMRFPRSIISVSPFRISILAVLLFLALYIANLDIFNFIELKAYDLRMVSRGVMQPGGEVAIAAIDEKSLKEIGRWPWPRSVMAELVSTLKGYGARAVGFDVVFAEPDRNSGLGEIEGIAKELRTMGFSDARLDKDPRREGGKGRHGRSVRGRLEKGGKRHPRVFLLHVREGGQAPGRPGKGCGAPGDCRLEIRRRPGERETR